MKKSIYKSQNPMILLILIILILIFMSIKLLLFYSKINMILKVILITFILLIQVILIVFLIKNIKDKILYKKLLDKGKKLPGTIEPIVEKRNNKEDYYLQIHFINPLVGVPTEFRTKRISINPYTSFKSNKCNIYFYKGAVIAEDFKLTDNPDESVFKKKEKEN